VLPGCRHTNTMYWDVVMLYIRKHVHLQNLEMCLHLPGDLTCWIYVHRQKFKFVLHLRGDVCVDALKSYSVAKTHRIPYLDRLFSSKEPYNWWLFCGKKPATQDILCIFATLLCVDARKTHPRLKHNINIFTYIYIV